MHIFLLEIYILIYIIKIQLTMIEFNQLNII